jgi:hypothetical protein
LARYAARKGLIYIAPNGSAAAAPLTASGMWSLNRETDKIDVTAFLDSNKVYVQGLPDVKGDIEAFWDDTDTTLFTAASSTAAVRMYLYPSQDALTKYAYGLAWIDASMDCAVADAVKIKSSFVAGGSWSQNF